MLTTLILAYKHSSSQDELLLCSLLVRLFFDTSLSSRVGYVYAIERRSMDIIAI